MTGSSPRLVGVVVFLVAAAVGVLLTSLVVGGFGGSATPLPSAVAQASASPTAIATSPSPSAPSAAAPTSSSEATSAPPSEPPTTPAATDKPTTAPGVPSAISFSALKLDAADDPAGKNRVITFDAVGAGTVSAVSPVGRGLLGRRRGDYASVELPDGRTRKLKVREIRASAAS